MSKTITIKVEQFREVPDEIPARVKYVEIMLEIDDIPTPEQWQQILDFEDKHIGGRPNDR